MTARAESSPDAFIEHYGRARVSLKAGRYAQAVNDLNAAYAIRPEPYLLLLLADTYIQLERRDEAIREFRRYEDAVADRDDRAKADPQEDSLSRRLRLRLRLRLRTTIIFRQRPTDDRAYRDAPIPDIRGHVPPEPRGEASLYLIPTSEAPRQMSAAPSDSGTGASAAASAAQSADAKKELSTPTSQGPRGESSVSSPGVGSPKAATNSARRTTPPIPRLDDVPAAASGTGLHLAPLARPIGPTPSPTSKDQGKPAQPSH